MLRTYARRLRKDMTLTENRLWYYLRNRRLDGYKFIRQKVLGNYIADFVCRDKWLIVEVDGGQHAESEAMAYDAKRTAYFVSLGYRVLRVWGSEVMENVEGVLEEILAWLEFVPE
jgi:very-short-patch-repair endonuclease